jgi:hypothetical protein
MSTTSYFESAVESAQSGVADEYAVPPSAKLAEALNWYGPPSGSATV